MPETGRSEAKKVQAELLGQAKQAIALKQELLEQQSGEGEATSVPAPKVGLLPKLRPCLVCISLGLSV